MMPDEPLDPMLPNLQESVLQFLRSGQVENAIGIASHATRHRPDNPVGWFLLGVAHHAAGHLDSALASFGNAIALAPGYLEAYRAIAALHFQMGNLAAAHDICTNGLAACDDHAALFVSHGICLEAMGNHEAALEAYNKALLLDPLDHDALLNRCALLARQGEYLAALKDNSALLNAFPGDIDGLFNRSEILMGLRRYNEALLTCRSLLDIAPLHGGGLLNQGFAMAALGQFEEAGISLSQCQKHDPDRYASSLKRASVYAGFQITTWDPIAIYLECGWHRSKDGDWSDRECLIETFRGYIEAHADSAVGIPYQNLAYQCLALPLSPPIKTRLLRAVARNISTRCRPILRQRNKLQGDRIRLGYISADFLQHPSAVLAARLFELHDRSRFEVLGYGICQDDGFALANKQKRDFDRFISLSCVDNGAAAIRIAADGVDILVDLTGLQKGARPEIAASRPAPIQVITLGFYNTTGCGWYDYRIVDRWISDEEDKKLSAEKLVMLPDCALITNNRLPISPGLSRQEYGLPEQAFIYCCFNNFYKIGPEIFSCWMRILKRVPDSVLWMQSSNGVLMSNLKSRAEKEGVAPSRLIFASWSEGHADHLARYARSDLFLDTPDFNAITTAADALWAGLPLLSCPGTGPFARMASSMLNAIGLPEMIVPNLQQYEDRAVHLASNRDELAAIRLKLAGNRLGQPLFDTERYIKHLEKAYELMWQHHCRGQEPAHISVPKILD